MLYAELDGKADMKICLEFFIILAREFRTEMEMNDYANMLFRFSFFWHPYSGIKILEQNCQEQSCKDYNTDLLIKYCQLVKQLEKDDLKPLDCIKAVGNFIGADITVLYHLWNRSSTQGDIKSINDLFHKQANNTKKVARGSRFKRIMNAYGVAESE